MPKTDKIRVSPELAHWTEYTRAEQQRRGWASESHGVIKFESGARTLTINTLRKKAYGQTAEGAEDGAKKRAAALIQRVLTSIESITEQE